MIKEVIKKENLLDLVRDITKRNLQDHINEVVAKYHSASYGVNKGDDGRSLIISLRYGNMSYYAIVRNDVHRITCEYGIKEFDLYDRVKTRYPNGYIEYMECNELAINLIRSIYEVLELGKVKRDD